jgi:hypothetical protein
MNNIYTGIFEITNSYGQKHIIENRVTDTYLNSLVYPICGITAPNIKIAYIAFGTSNADLGNDPTQLGAEYFRTPCTIEPHVVDAGIVETEFVVLENEAIGEIKEMGIFGGDATSTAGTGILISRVLWEYTKTGTDKLTITRRDGIRRA